MVFFFQYLQIQRLAALRGFHASCHGFFASRRWCFEVSASRSRDNSRHAFFEFQIPCIFSADRKHALALSCNRIVNALVGVFHDADSNFRFHGVPFYGFDFDLSVEMLAVAVALMTLTLLFVARLDFGALLW